MKHFNIDIKVTRQLLILDSSLESQGEKGTLPSSRAESEVLMVPTASDTAFEHTVPEQSRYTATDFRSETESRWRFL